MNDTQILLEIELQIYKRQSVDHHTLTSCPSGLVRILTFQKENSKFSYFLIKK